MGRGDGSGRLVSPEGADDAGTGILHVDMDAFYASVEILYDPSLRGLPLIIGAPDGRSVVSSASYEARRFGVRSAMPVSQALRLCPQARVVPPDFTKYRAVSSAVMDVFHSVTPLVEQLSIDEAFLDVRGVRRLWGSPGRIAVLLRRRVQEEVGITCSVGVAATKHVAKMASTISKPDGMLIVPAARTQEFLDPRPVGAMWGVGPKAAEALERRGIRLIRDVRETPLDALSRAVGPALAQRMQQLARGAAPTTAAEQAWVAQASKALGVVNQAVSGLVSIAAQQAKLGRDINGRPLATGEDDSFELQVLRLVNAERARYGLAAVTYDRRLDAAAESHNAQ